MINREIIYERNLTGSYMKIPAGMGANLDEKLMLKRKLPGLLPVEKAYVDGDGQYWYNISGKQSLDTYCRMKEIGIEFIERLIISICSEMEMLEWNMIHTSCLMLDPELIFVTHAGKDCGQFLSRIVLEINKTVEAGTKTGVGVQKLFHQIRVSGDNDNEIFAVIFHAL